MRALPLFLLLACAPEEDSWQASPPSQSLDLSITPVVPGQQATWTVDGLNPGEQVFLLRGIDTTFGAAGCPAFLGGLCVDLVPPVRVVTTLTANNNGVARYSARVPAGLTVGDLAGFQAVAIRGPGGADSTKSGPELVRADPPFTLFSPDVQPNPSPTCDIILPSSYWCGSDNPEIRWTGVPANTISLAFLYTDQTLNAPQWAVYNMPPTLAAIAPGSSGGGFFFPPRATEISPLGGPWYGACSSGANTYEWKIVALDRRFNSPGGTFQSEFAALETFVARHSIAEATLCQE